MPLSTPVWVPVWVPRVGAGSVGAGDMLTAKAVQTATSNQCQPELVSSNMLHQCYIYIYIWVTSPGQTQEMHHRPAAASGRTAPPMLLPNAGTQPCSRLACLDDNGDSLPCMPHVHHHPRPPCPRSAPRSVSAAALQLWRPAPISVRTPNCPHTRRPRWTPNCPHTRRPRWPAPALVLHTWVFT